MNMPPQPKLISPSKQLAFVLGQRLSFSRFPSPPPPPPSPPPPSSGRRHPGVRIWPLRRPPSCARPVAGPVDSSCARPVAGPVASSPRRPSASPARRLSQARPCSASRFMRPRPSSGPVASCSAPSPPAAPSLSPAPAASLPPSPLEQDVKSQLEFRNDHYFCKLAANEKVKGNRPTKFLNPAGYKNVEVGFLQQTGKLYSWNDETNTVIADDEWWKKAGEENKDFLQFRKCGPDNLDEMSIMYENINVTGESSMMPGCEHEVLDLEDEIEEIEGTQAKKAKKFPVKIDGTSSKKNHVQRDFKRMVDHLISEDAAMNSHKNSVATEIEKIMEDVVACGADEQSDEYFIATKADTQ
ncbi:hypothetical protein ZWY2020_019523 [Hordeum vulgare]|nr:hypothetical protein ZWY2020_019523 [Hordeum vulgare]